MTDTNLMQTRTPQDFQKLDRIAINHFYEGKNLFEVLIENLVLGQVGVFGYYNHLGAKRRIVAAAIQTFWSVAAMYYLGEWMQGFEINPKQPIQPFYIANILNACGLIAAIFGAAFFREMKDIHNKWDYLAKTFNDTIKLPPKYSDDLAYNPRDHLSACLAHDILTMNMWAHRSFRAFFKEMLEKAVREKHKNNELEINNQLLSIAQNGIAFADADELITFYLESKRHSSDRPTSPVPIKPAA
jgi:hypothetical protein